MSLTTEQTLMHEVVNKIADKYNNQQTDRLIEDAKKLTTAILYYSNDKKASE